MDILIKVLEKDLKPITSAHEGEWIDLRAAEDINMIPGDYRKIRLGIAVQLPEGYEAIIAPRSSTFSKWGITMSGSIGVIDNLFCGENDEWSFPAIAWKHTKIHKNDRICQFRIIKCQPKIDILYVDELKNKNRGGFGSTGKD